MALRKYAMWPISALQHAAACSLRLSALHLMGKCRWYDNLIRRCSASIPANIAEGCGRSGDAGLGRLLLISMGSASELEYHLLLARDLGYLHSEQHQALSQRTQEVKRVLSTFITKLRHTKP